MLLRLEIESRNLPYSPHLDVVVLTVAYRSGGVGNVGDAVDEVADFLLRFLFGLLGGVEFLLYLLDQASQVVGVLAFGALNADLLGELVAALLQRLKRFDLVASQFVVHHQLLKSLVEIVAVLASRIARQEFGAHLFVIFPNEFDIKHNCLERLLFFGRHGFRQQIVQYLRKSKPGAQGGLRQNGSL